MDNAGRRIHQRKISYDFGTTPKEDVGMGLMRWLFGGGATTISRAMTDVAEVFTPNATRQMELGHEAFTATVAQHGTEFAHSQGFLFDRLINGLNRLPRPMLALGTLGLFIYAMVDPIGFSARMEGLAYVPDPLWWLLGAIVSFYFGARELHYRRRVQPPVPASPRSDVKKAPDGPDLADNSALVEWQSSRSG
jgi:hypothetical protein